MDCNYAKIYWVPLLSYGMLNKYAKTCFPKPINNVIKKKHYYIFSHLQMMPPLLIIWPSQGTQWRIRKQCVNYFTAGGYDCKEVKQGHSTNAVTG